MQSGLLHGLRCQVPGSSRLPRLIDATTVPAAIIPNRPITSKGRKHICSPCRITNERAEVMKALGLQDRDEMDTFEVDETPVWDPEKGPIEERIAKTLLDEVQTDEINIQETAYWFTEPPDGWQLTKDYYKPVYVEADFPNPKIEEDLDQRLPLEEYELGEELGGIVTDIWLYHGVQVDFGAHYAGLIPVRQEEWPDIQEKMVVGRPVPIRIHKFFDPELYRWPVLLELTEEDTAALIMSPDDFEPPANIHWAQEQGMTPEEVAKVLGRDYTPSSFYDKMDDQFQAEEMQYYYGKDDPDLEPYEEDWITRELDPGTELMIEKTMIDFADMSS